MFPLLTYASIPKNILLAIKEPRNRSYIDGAIIAKPVKNVQLPMELVEAVRRIASLNAQLEEEIAVLKSTADYQALFPKSSREKANVRST